MAKKVVDETSLTSIANAIREKTGASDALVFPTGMVEAIAGISAGGGGNKVTCGIFVEENSPQESVLTFAHNLDEIPTLFVFIDIDSINGSPDLELSRLNAYVISDKTYRYYCADTANARILRTYSSFSTYINSPPETSGTRPLVSADNKEFTITTGDTNTGNNFFLGHKILWIAMVI